MTTTDARLRPHDTATERLRVGDVGPALCRSAMDVGDHQRVAAGLA